MAPTPEWWLDRLASLLDLRRPELNRLRAYLDGDAPLPDGAEGCKDAYKQFQRKSRTNFAEIVTDAVGDRMAVAGFRVGDSNDDDDEARAIWKRNHLGIWSHDVHRDMLGLSAGYMCVQPGPRDNDPVDVVYERPEQVITDHDPARPDRVRAALKVYRDEVEGYDRAYVHHLDDDSEGFVTPFERAIPKNKDGVPQPLLTIRGGWMRLREGDPARPDEMTVVEPEPTGLRFIPIVPFINRGGQSEFGTHTDVLDRINWVVLQRLVLIALQAYRQRALETGDDPLPENDEEGNPIDYGKLFKPGAGALWELPPGVKIWESQQADIQGVLAAAKDDIRDLGAVTRTPMSMLIPDGQNQSAEGAAFAKEGLIFKAEDRIERAKVSWAQVIGFALAIAKDLPEPPEVDVLLAPPTRLSLGERFDALSKSGNDVPWRTKMTRILGYDGDDVDRMAMERAEDLALAAGFAGEPDDAPVG